MNARKKFYFNEGNKFVVDAVPLDANTLLDIGCGSGSLAKSLQARNVTVDGITLSPLEAESAALYCRKVFVHDIEKGLPPDLTDHYDCIICSHVLEHLCYPDNLLRDIRKLIGNGVLIVAIPNLLFYKNRLKLMAGKFEYETNGLMDDTHFRWYTFATAQALLYNHGFEKICAVAEGSFPLFFFRRFFGGGLVNILDRLACRRFPGLFGYQLLFVYKKSDRDILADDV